jgi:hypothetical protein
VVSQQCAQRRPATPRPLTRAPTNHQQVVMSAEDAARRAWLAKQDQPITSAAGAKAAWLAKQDVPSWGHEVVALAEARQHTQDETRPFAVPGGGSCGLLWPP